MGLGTLRALGLGLLVAALAAASPRAKAKMKPNHLIREKSPYLLQHAYNPVDWHSWGEAAFEKARREAKPILLSIGYSTCHWCHVMERESFSDPRIAALMNKHFVSIKLDREERPDVDKIYMTAVQAMSGQGGWPLNVFLTPELKPFYGGTYFPPQARWGQPSWPGILERISELWRTRKADVEKDASRMAQALKAYAASESSRSAPQAQWLDRAYEGFRGGFDPEQGGFGGAPKFPMPSNLNLLLRYWARVKDAQPAKAKQGIEMLLASLRAMARGGIYDQMGGGFHRYSTDAQWRVPHFEKMLYDNAQLASVYLDAYQASRDPEFSRVAEETLEYVLRDMSRPEGGFYSAEDADSLPPELAAKGVSGEGHEHKAEGAFYLWSVEEVQGLLGSDAEAFIHRYGMKAQGNAPADPHGEFAGKNILFVRHTLEETARKLGAKPEEISPRLLACREKLLAARAKRPRPGLDDKILASWNGLMISAFAKASQVLGRPAYLQAAAKAASFLRAELYDAKEGRLFHRWREGERAVPGLADDYAFLGQGLLDLYEASFDVQWLDWAVELSERQSRLFGSAEGGFYMTAEGHDKSLLARVMEDSDNVEPCASSVSALNLLRLAQFTAREDFRAAAQRTLERFGSRMAERPLSLPQMLVAVDFALSKPRQVVIAGEAQDPGTQRLLAELRSRFIPAKIVLLADAASKPGLQKRLPFLKGVAPIGGKSTAYLCRDYACELPTSDPEAFAAMLDAMAPAPR